MKFAQVEREDGLKTYVNTGQVQYFEGAPAGSRIHFTDGQTVLLVLHSPDQLAVLFRNEVVVQRQG